MPDPVGDLADPCHDAELVKVIAAAGRFYQACLERSWVPGYLASRKLDAALLPGSPWRIGYAPAGWTTLLDQLRRDGFSDTDMLRAGLVTTGRNGQLRDYFHDRLIIPLRAEDHTAVGFIGRRHPDTSDDRGPKYLNTPDTQIFTKGRTLAGLAEGSNAFSQGAQPVLTEGPLDAIAVSIAAPGRYAGIAPCGTALTGHQAAALARAVPLDTRGVLVAFDGDTAGRAAAVRAYWRLIAVTTTLTSITFPGGTDPAAILQIGGPAALAHALSSGVRPLADLVIDTRIADWANGRELDWPELQAGAIQAAASAMAIMPPGHVGPQAARLCALFAERYGWKPHEVTTELIDAIERNLASPSPGPMRGEPREQIGSPWSVVARATAPSGRRPSPDGVQPAPAGRLQLAQQRSSQRDV